MVTKEKSNRYAFRLIRYSKLNDLATIEINFSLEERIFCPADGTKLITVVTLFGNKGKQRMRVGTCISCGLISYIDYPSEEWLQGFYSSEWLRTTEVDVLREVKRRKYMTKKQVKADRAIRTDKIAKFLDRHNLNKNRPIFEIGCGYGQSLAYFKEKGYKVLGCESSRFRARVAKRAYRLTVANVPFENFQLQNKLKKLQFGLIFSHHVLEHVTDPNSLVQRASKLQAVGDYIIIGVPDAYTEPTMMSLFYFPHRSAFTKQSLINLFHSNAYEMVDDFSDQEELYLVGRRVKKPIKIEKGNHYKNQSFGKFTAKLGLGKWYLTPVRRLWGHRRLGFDNGGQVLHWEFAEHLFGKWYRIVVHKLLMIYLVYRYRTLEDYLACIVKDVLFRYSKISQSPIEIQFKKNIILLTK